MEIRRIPDSLRIIIPRTCTFSTGKTRSSHSHIEVAAMTVSNENESIGFVYTLVLNNLSIISSLYNNEIQLQDLSNIHFAGHLFEIKRLYQ